MVADQSTLKYTTTHEWISIDKDIATMGITDYAQKALGDIVYIEIPDEDEEVTKSKTVCIIESIKAASDIYAPVSGKIIKVNNKLVDHPELINEQPIDDGWILKIKISNPAELEELLDYDDYRAHTE